MKKDLIDEITDKLSAGNPSGEPYSINELHRAIGSPNKTNYMESIKKAVRMGLVEKTKTRSDSRKICLVLPDKNQKIMNFIKHFSNNLKTQKQLVNSYFKNLEERKDTWQVAEQTEIEEPMYVARKKGKKGKQILYDIIPTKPQKRMRTSWKLDKKTIEHLESILKIIDNMFTYSGVFTYILTLEILQKSYNKEIKDYQKLSIDTVKDIVTKLDKITEKSNYFIHQYIANRLMPYHTINQLEQISKIKPMTV